MEELIERVNKLNSNQLLKNKVEENNSINLKLFEIKKNIVLFYTNNKLNNEESLVKLKNIISFLLKTQKLKYGYEKKLNRLNMIIKELN